MAISDRGSPGHLRPELPQSQSLIPQVIKGTYSGCLFLCLSPLFLRSSIPLSADEPRGLELAVQVSQ